MLCEFGMELEIGHNSMRIIVYFQTGSRLEKKLKGGIQVRVRLRNGNSKSKGGESVGDTHPSVWILALMYYFLCCLCLLVKRPKKVLSSCISIFTSQYQKSGLFPIVHGTPGELFNSF